MDKERVIGLSKDEAVEIESFKERRKFFGGDLSVKNVHNVATDFPNMYTRIFHTNGLDTDLFCMSCPAYSDADEAEVARYESAIRYGYEVEK